MSMKSPPYVPLLEQWRTVRTEKGSYRVIERLGMGGNSVVYLVQATSGAHQGVMFALKILFNIDKRDRVERFHNEVAFLQTCDHPCILGLHDAGILPDRREAAAVEYPFVIAEFLPKTLRSAERGGLTISEKVAYCIQLLSALGYLETRSVTHRDIKPENIFIKGSSCILGDFGLFKALEPDAEFDIEHSTGPRHPYRYPTPDLVSYAKDESVGLTSKSDVFQLGLVFCELFSGVVPLAERPNNLAPVQIIQPLPKFDGLQSQTILLLIEKMLTPDPVQRPSAQALMDQWMGVFREIFQAHLSLEGRVFAVTSG